MPSLGSCHPSPLRGTAESSNRRPMADHKETNCNRRPLRGRYFPGSWFPSAIRPLLLAIGRECDWGSFREPTCQSHSVSAGNRNERLLMDTFLRASRSCWAPADTCRWFAWEREERSGRNTLLLSIALRAESVSSVSVLLPLQAARSQASD